MKKISSKNILTTRLSYTYQLIVAVVLFIVAVFASRGADMHPWEISLFNSVYNKPEFFRPFVFIFTQAGSIHMLGLLLLISLIIKNYTLLTRLLLTSTLAFLISGFSKDIWGRLRPNEIIEGVSNLDYVVRGPGFPSGHVALATAMALVVGSYLPRKYKIIVPIWIIGVALSRVYLGVHAPLDIVGGFAIGWASYALVNHLEIRNIIGPAVSEKIRTRRNNRKKKSRK